MRKHCRADLSKYYCKNKQNTFDLNDVNDDANLAFDDDDDVADDDVDCACLRQRYCCLQQTQQQQPLQAKCSWTMRLDQRKETRSCPKLVESFDQSADGCDGETEQRPLRLLQLHENRKAKATENLHWQLLDD